MNGKNLEALQKMKDQLSFQTDANPEEMSFAELFQQSTMEPMEEEREPAVQVQVAKLVNGSPFEGFLLVRSAEVRTGKTGRAYMDLKLGDATGELVCKLWNYSESIPVPAAGSVVNVAGAVESYNGQLQMRLQYLRAKPDVTADEKAMLVPSAPESPESMRKEIEETIAGFKSEMLRRLISEMLNMADADGRLNTFPAAQRMHHAELAGLLHHTTSMLRAAKALSALYNDLYPELIREDLLLAGVIIHDLAKLDEMISDDFGVVSDYSADGLLVGHIVRGVCNLDRAARKVGVSGELVLMLEHMLLSHHGIPEYGSPRAPMFPEAELLHILDMMDARMNELKGIEDRTAPGTFSERIGSLDGRRIYHPVYKLKMTEPEEE